MDGKRTQGEGQQEQGQQEQRQKESESGRDCIFQVGRFSIYRRQLSGTNIFILECAGKNLFESENLYDVYQQCVLRHCQEKFYVSRQGDKWVVINSGVQVVNRFATHKEAMAVATALNMVEARRVQDV